MTQTEFGRAIKFHREKRGMSLQILADEAGISKNHAWDLERGASRNPTIETVLNIAAALEVDPAALALCAMSGVPSVRRAR